MATCREITHNALVKATTLDGTMCFEDAYVRLPDTVKKGAAYSIKQRFQDQGWLGIHGRFPAIEDQEIFLQLVRYADKHKGNKSNLTEVISSLQQSEVISQESPEETDAEISVCGAEDEISTCVQKLLSLVSGVRGENAELTARCETLQKRLAHSEEVYERTIAEMQTRLTSIQALCVTE